MFNTRKKKLKVLQEAKRLLKKDALKVGYGEFVNLMGICGYLFKADRFSGFKEPLAYRIVKEDLVKFKPEGKPLGGYWWPLDIEHVPVRQEVLNQLIEQYSTTPWYKRLLNYFEK